MSCSRRKPLDASAMSAVRWGVTLQDSGVEMSSVLPAEQATVSSKLAWLLWAFYKQIPFFSTNQNSVAQGSLF